MFLRIRRLFKGLILVCRETLVFGQDIEKKYYKDEMTGLCNTSTILDLGKRALSTVKRQEGSLSVVHLDLDDFKWLNDEFGHAFGDEVLREIGRVLREGLRSSDLAGRIGGDEFLLILPFANQDSALAVVRRIQGLNEVVEFSYGVCVSTLTRHSNITLEEMIASADEQMYQQKRSKGHKH